MPKVGDKEFPYTPEGMAAAKAESQNMGIPVNDGANRSVTEYAGGGKTGYSSIGMQRPMMGAGGKMEPTREMEPTRKMKPMGEKAKMKPMGKKAKNDVQKKKAKKKEWEKVKLERMKKKGLKKSNKGMKFEKYEDGGKTSERKSDIEIKPGKYKKTSKVVKSVGSIDAEAEARLKDKLSKKSKDNDANLKIKGEIDSLKNVLKNETNSMKKKLLEEKINAKNKLIAKKDSLKKDLKKDTHNSDMDAMKAKLKAAGM